MIQFRALMPEDAEDVARVEYESFPTPWSREDFWREASNDFACYIVALADDSIIGFGGCWISFEEAQVTNIALTAAQRGRGLGRILMKKLMHAAAARARARMPPDGSDDACRRSARSGAHDARGADGEYTGDPPL